MPCMTHNGPAIWGGCVTRREHRAGSWYPEYSGPENCHGARRVWRTFCRPGASFIELYECRGTSMIGAANLSPVTKLMVGTGVVSRYNVERSQLVITIHKALLHADARVRVQKPLRICLECRNKSKKCDKQLTHIVRVMLRHV